MLVVGARGSGAFAAMILGSVSRYAAAHASCPVAIIRDETMAVHRRVGVGIRDAGSCQDALAFAFEEATQRHVTLTAVHAWRGPTAHAAQEAAAQQLTELLASYPGTQVHPEIVHGHPGRVLAGLSARADLTFLGGHAPHGAGPRGPGTVTHAVLNHAHGPVVTVPSSRQP